MTNKVEWDRMIAGELYSPYRVNDHSFSRGMRLRSCLMSRSIGLIRAPLRN